jgi:hypothetical protein
VGAGITSDDKTPLRAATISRKGTEYLESRNYQPGDSLKDIDWKHSIKLSQLIVKEYNESSEQAAIIAVNLSVTDVEAADRVAFNLITSALTLARENIPTALAAYNHQDVVLNKGITESPVMLREAMSLVKDIRVVEFDDRHLEPIDIAKIRRNIRQLKEAESEPAKRLLDILRFEHRSIEEMSRNHPATAALLAATKEVPTPAMIILVSQLNHDAEAMLVNAEKLSRRRFTTVPIECS